MVFNLKENDEWKANTSEKFQNYVSQTWWWVYGVSDALKKWLIKFKWKTNTEVNWGQDCKFMDLLFCKCSLKDLSWVKKYNC